MNGLKKKKKKFSKYRRKAKKYEPKKPKGRTKLESAIAAAKEFYRLTVAAIVEGIINSQS